jgi:hypothetical protein
MRKVEEIVKGLGIPTKERYDLPTSPKRFPDGAHYRIEVPGIASPAALEAVIKVSKKHELVVNRITETRGIMRQADSDIKDMAAICKEAGIELIFSVGVRASLDTSAQRAVGTYEGGRVANRLRGASRLMWAIEDVVRGTELGIRGILLYDEGFLWVVDELRKEGAIPKNTIFKVSAHCGHGNPASIKLLARLGANSINPVRDLELPMIASLRAASDVSLDIHTDNPRSTGGFVRTYEAPEMVRIAAPVYLKCGGSVFEVHASEAAALTSTQQAEAMARQAGLVQRMIEKHFAEGIQSKPFAKDLAIPE